MFAKMHFYNQNILCSTAINVSQLCIYFHIQARKIRNILAVSLKCDCLLRGSACVGVNLPAQVIPKFDLMRCRSQYDAVMVHWTEDSCAETEE